MDRRFPENELSRVIKDSLDTHVNMLPYVCRENIDSWHAIKRNIRVVVKHSITPEQYWHGDAKEFEWLLTLLSDDYPSKEELLKLASHRTKGEINNVANYFYQHVVIMFSYVKEHHGYCVLRPTAYMECLFPDSKGCLYVYTLDKWNHNETSCIDGAVLVLNENEMNELPRLLKKKLGIMT